MFKIQIETANDAFWSYQAATATPSLQAAIDAGAISATTTQAQWDAMSPGMRREIVRSLTKAGKADRKSVV